MKKSIPIIFSILIIFILAWYVKGLKEKNSFLANEKVGNIGIFTKQRSCAKHPNFLQKLKIPQPIAIDLSQKQHKGLAFLYGQGLSKAVHLKTWEKFDYFSTYALDPKGNMFLTPMPFISVKEKTFEFQKNIYKLDSNSGKLFVWKSFDEVHASGNNPFGLMALVYDCDDDSLWVSAVDETDYAINRGLIYHIDIKSKKIIEKIEGIDALSLKIVKSTQGKFLLFGGARKNALYALNMETLKVKKLFELPNTHEHIRKIKVRGKHLLELQTIPFSYTLIAETSGNDVRKYYILRWDEVHSSWNLSKNTL